MLLLNVNLIDFQSFILSNEIFKTRLLEHFRSVFRGRRRTNPLVCCIFISALIFSQRKKLLSFDLSTISLLIGLEEYVHLEKILLWVIDSSVPYTISTFHSLAKSCKRFSELTASEKQDFAANSSAVNCKSCSQLAW